MNFYDTKYYDLIELFKRKFELEENLKNINKEIDLIGLIFEDKEIERIKNTAVEEFKNENIKK